MFSLKYILLGVFGIIIASFAYYGISPLFRDIHLDEKDPSENVADQIQRDSPVSQEESQTRGATVIGTIGHPASGSVRIIHSEGKTYIRYENFKTINGPDLFVYLAKDKEAKEFINLGALKATEGNINYEVPSNIDIEDYSFVLTWCRMFSVLFNSADLNEAR